MKKHRFTCERGSHSKLCFEGNSPFAFKHRRPRVGGYQRFGGKRAQRPRTGKSCFVFVFALRVCVRACVRAKLCEGPRVDLFRVSGLWPGRERTGRKPSIRAPRRGPRLGPRLGHKKGPKVGPPGPPLTPPKSSYHACVALWILLQRAHF